MDKIKLEVDLVQVLTGNPGCNVTYVLNVSERARAVLGSVKRLLIQTLLAKASLGDSLFNMVGFSNTVHCWSLHMLPCLPNTVFTAFPWVHSVSCSLGRHLLAALKAALSDPACHTVHLLCTDLPEQPGLLLRFLSALETCRPINVFYLQGPSSGLERSARDYLLCLSQATRGSCYLIMFDLEGNLEKVIPIHIVDSQPSTPASQTKCSHSASTIKYQPTSPALRCRPSVGEFSSGSCVLCGPAVAGSEFFPSHRVLARRQADGLFYPGSVIQEVQDCKGLWVVEFDRGGSAASSQRELVCSLDLVVDSRGHNHRLVPGDFVLSPWESDLRRYGPGRVVAVAPHRADVVADLQVLMWNSSVSLVPDSLVLPVSLYHYFRLVRQLQIPAPVFGRCCSRVCGKSPCPLRRPYTHCCQSTHTQLPCVVPTSCRSGLEEPCHFNRDEFVRNGHSETPSPPPTSPTIQENTSNSPEAKLWSNRRRPPWRYWRRTGPEPQHKQPGSEVNRTMSQPSSLPVPQISSSPNHSSLFQSLPDVNAKNMNIRDVFGTASFKPRPPAQRQSFSAGKAALIPT
ncbi:uncharacterized protein C11orf16 homolog [Poecilia latipinna]|uniref:uncharacterized protein C11orf16 homolog n=1 Tax=Poecilia latipinna TaxID=48699 RepID=UPI00072EEA0D|nr:PREDICTED: uncharacterized protein C11orf16 homolog [Poecilia latipinna]